MDADGSNVIRLTSVWGEMPAWSPDGMLIAFVRDTQIYVMDADGNNVIQLTNDTMPNLKPSWSSDGTRIAFECYSENVVQICVMGADGSNIVRLTNGPWHHCLPAWSPDGTRIAFASNRWTENVEGHYFTDEIFLMDTDGGNIVQLTDSRPYENTEPAWSPNGQHIVFSCATKQGAAICMMPADGGDVIQLTGGEVRASEPTWSP
jgi:TolB protein